MMTESQKNRVNKRFGVFLILALVLALSVGAGSTSIMADHDAEGGPTEFTVRITNISRGNTLQTSEGTFLSVPLAPGVWAIHEQGVSLFTAGQAAGTDGLEALAEDGNAADLGRTISRGNQYRESGIFNMPFGSETPGPIGPGQAYVFTFIAEPGDRLSFASMFVQSNDLFYAPDDEGIGLFNDERRPLQGDITSLILLWDAGTEVNQEPGVGEDQAPRQSEPNTGADENGVVRLVNDGYSYPAVDEVINVVISARRIDEEEES